MSSACRNCAEPVSLSYCPRCGQEVDSHRAPLAGLVGEFLSEFFSVDGKHLRTALGIWLPGRLTELYLEGKRASYVRPVRVYLVSSLLFFLLVGFPAPNAEENNVYIDGVLIGREEPDPELGNFQLGLSAGSGTDELVSRAVAEKNRELQALPAQQVLDRFFGNLERTIPTALICFVPILALGIKLLYVRKPFYYVEHLVFSLHYQSFLFLALTLGWALNQLGLQRTLNGFAPYLAVIAIIGPLYLAFALRRVYQQGWGITVLKTLALFFLYFALLQPVFAATMYFVLRAM